MAIGTAQFDELLWPGIEALFGTTYRDYPAMWERLVTKHTSNRAFEKFQGLTGYGLAGVKAQGGTVPYNDRYQGFGKEIINVTYAIGSTITYEMLLFEQYNQFQRTPAMLADSIRYTEETVVANILNNGFSTSLTADGLTLFNTAHLLVANAATQNNRPTTNNDFSQTALEQAYIDIGNWVDDQNIPKVFMPTLLVVPIESQHTARVVLDTEYKTGTANNDINPVASAKMPLDLQVNPYITDTDSWFLKTNEEDGIVFTDADPVRLDRDNDFDTKNQKFSATRIFGAGAVNYLGYYGSPGT